MMMMAMLMLVMMINGGTVTILCAVRYGTREDPMMMVADWLVGLMAGSSISSST